MTDDEKATRRIDEEMGEAYSDARRLGAAERWLGRRAGRSLLITSIDPATLTTPTRPGEVYFRAFLSEDGHLVAESAVWRSVATCIADATHRVGAASEAS